MLDRIWDVADRDPLLELLLRRKGLIQLEFECIRPRSFTF
jgi:hypothetical protein